MTNDIDCFDVRLKTLWKEVILQYGAVLQGLVPTFDLALGFAGDKGERDCLLLAHFLRLERTRNTAAIDGTADILGEFLRERLLSGVNRLSWRTAQNGRK